MKNGIYLTPGAARTAYYVGALHLLMTDAKIHFDVIAGTSVGVLNGAFAAMSETEKLIKIWQNWNTDDVMVNDYGAILKGGFFWTKNFSSNRPEYKTGVKDYIFEEKITDNTLLRFNIANLTTGQNRIFQYPGEGVPLQKAVMAAVSVPVVFEPVEIEGDQCADGLAIEGCLLDELLLSTGVDRVFVLGVSPSQLIKNAGKSIYKMLLSATEWNQYSEPLLAISEAKEINEMIKNWQQHRRILKQSIREMELDASEKSLAQSVINEVMDASEFPYERETVEIIPIMPEEPINMWFGDFKPERSKRLIDRGREDAIRIVENL